MFKSTIVSCFLLFSIANQLSAQENIVKIGFQMERNSDIDGFVPNALLEYEKSICNNWSVYANAQYGKRIIISRGILENTFINSGIALGVNYNLLSKNRYSLKIGGGASYRNVIVNAPMEYEENSIWGIHNIKYQNSRGHYYGFHFGVANQYQLSEKMMMELNMNYHSFPTQMQTFGANVKIGYRF